MGERGAKNMWVLRSIGISESIPVLFRGPRGAIRHTRDGLFR